MAQKKIDVTGRFGKAVKNHLPDEGDTNDTVTPEGMRLVRERMTEVLKNRTLRSVSDKDRVLSFG